MNFESSHGAICAQTVAYMILLLLVLYEHFIYLNF